VKFAKVATLAVAAIASVQVLAPHVSAEQASAATVAPVPAYGPQYTTAHVYVEHGQQEEFIHSWEATFGGTNNPPSPVDITPTRSTVISSIIKSPVGLLSTYDYQTPIPFPFGHEQAG